MGYKLIEDINFKLDRNSEKIDSLDLRLRVSESNIRKDIKTLRDETDTMMNCYHDK